MWRTLWTLKYVKSLKKHTNFYLRCIRNANWLHSDHHQWAEACQNLQKNRSCNNTKNVLNVPIIYKSTKINFFLYSHPTSLSRWSGLHPVGSSFFQVQSFSVKKKRNKKNDVLDAVNQILDKTTRFHHTDRLSWYKLFEFPSSKIM